MELPVDERDLDVDHRVPRQHALGHRLDDALLDRRDELLGDRSSEDLVLVDEAFPPRERLDLDLAHRVLPVAPALLHVPALRLRLGPDRLPVGDLRGLRLHLDAELRLEALHLHAEVCLTHPVDHRLVGLVVAGHAERRVLLAEARQAGGEPVLLTLRLGRDRVGEERLRELHRRELHRIVLRGERVSGVGVGELRDRADVAGRHLGHGLVFLALEREELSDPLVGPLRRVVDGAVGADLAAEDPEHRDVPDEGVRHGLEHEGAQGSVGIARPLLLLATLRDHLRAARDRAGKGTPRR